ncbi:MAG: TlpA disulfide reductase family protein [Acidimicrobiales bacterium]|jgi:thiol-disulfide isomerase/thioredoxin
MATGGPPAAEESLEGGAGASLRAEAPGRRHQRAIACGLVSLVLLGAGFVAYAVSVSRSVPTPKYANLVVYASPAKAPSFDLASLDSSGRVSSATLQGGPVVVNWFQSTCVACQAELGTFASVADSERTKAHFVGIDINDPSTSAALAMVRRAKADYPIAQAPGVASISLATDFGVGDLPATVFVSPSGRILGEVLGKVPRAELVAVLDNLVAGRPLDS